MARAGYSACHDTMSAVPSGKIKTRDRTAEPPWLVDSTSYMVPADTADVAPPETRMPGFEASKAAATMASTRSNNPVKSSVAKT